MNHIHPISDDELETIVSACSLVEFDKNEIVTRQGYTENYLYFVLKGHQRSYTIKKGKEHVMGFTYPISFSGVPESFLNQNPSDYFLECITDSVMLKMSYTSWLEIINKNRNIERLFLKSTSLILEGLIHRHLELMTYSIEERFTAFMNRDSNLINEIPHKHIASYLSIDSTNFSKLLNSVKS